MMPAVEKVEAHLVALESPLDNDMKIFISYHFSDTDYRNDLAQFFQRNGGPVRADPVWCDEFVHRPDEASIMAAIKAAIERCDGVLVVLGADTHSRNWVEYELDVASGWNKWIGAVRHPQSTGGLPSRYSHVELYPWRSDELCSAINRWAASRGL